MSGQLCLKAQQGEWEGWLHPELSASIYVIPLVDMDELKYSDHSLTAISASFNSGGKLSGSFTYDVIGAKIMGYELLYRPYPWLGVRVGLQRSPYFMETRHSPRYLEAVGYSQAASYLGGYSRDLSGKNSRSRDFGISLEGTIIQGEGFPVLSYVAGIFNGNGYNIRDDNSFKDIEGIVVYQPVKEVRLSLGGMLGRINSKEGALVARDRLSSALWWDNGTFFVRMEDMFGLTDRLRSNGYSVIGGWWFNEKMALSSRFDRFDLDLEDPASATTKLECCFTHMLLRRDISYRIQYGHTFYADGTAGRNLLSFTLVLRLGAKL